MPPRVAPSRALSCIGVAYVMLPNSAFECPSAACCRACELPVRGRSSGCESEWPGRPGIYVTGILLPVIAISCNLFKSVPTSTVHLDHSSVNLMLSGKACRVVLVLLLLQLEMLVVT
jgi:hypothetical protein